MVDGKNTAEAVDQCTASRVNGMTPSAVTRPRRSGGSWSGAAVTRIWGGRLRRPAASRSSRTWGKRFLYGPGTTGTRMNGGAAGPARWWAATSTGVTGCGRTAMRDATEGTMAGDPVGHVGAGHDHQIGSPHQPSDHWDLHCQARPKPARACSSPG